MRYSVGGYGLSAKSIINEVPMCRTDQERTAIHLSVYCAICDSVRHQRLPVHKEARGAAATVHNEKPTCDRNHGPVYLFSEPRPNVGSFLVLLSPSAARFFPITCFCPSAKPYNFSLIGKTLGIGQSCGGMVCLL